jgi:hypothetical protein
LKLPLFLLPVTSRTVAKIIASVTQAKTATGNQRGLWRARISVVTARRKAPPPIALLAPCFTVALRRDSNAQ